MNDTSDWNKRYGSSENLFGIKPNEFMLSQANLFACKSNGVNLGASNSQASNKKTSKKISKKALSIADGEGFNSLWLAQQGFNVTSLDISMTAHEKAKKNEQKTINDKLFSLPKIHFVCADILKYSLPPASFDLITVFFLHINNSRREELHKKISQILKPGGIILYECFHTAQGTPCWGPKDIDLLINENKLLRDFTDFTTLFINKESTVSYEEKHGQKNVITLQYVGLKK